VLQGHFSREVCVLVCGGSTPFFFFCVFGPVVGCVVGVWGYPEGGLGWVGRCVGGVPELV